MIPRAGTQLWADTRWRDGWRVQSHWSLGTSRLLDASSQVRFTGSRLACERALEEAQPSGGDCEHLVVMLHGLGRTRHSMRRLQDALEGAGLTTACLDYPSTRRPIEAHAATVADLLDHVPIPRKLSFVTHSLGGLITRELLRYDNAWRGALHRIFMMAPPNQGSAIAGSIDGAVMRTILGPSFAQVVEGIAPTLPVPEVPVSIFAGKVGAWSGDGVVAVSETFLTGMAEHHVVPTIHTLVMNHPVVIRGAVSFLSAAPK